MERTPSRRAEPSCSAARRDPLFCSTSAATLPTGNDVLKGRHYAFCWERELGHRLINGAKVTALDVDIEGPYGRPKFEGQRPMLPSVRGVYLLAFEHRDGFLPYWVGVTRRAMRMRFAEHARKQLAGDYNVLDVDGARQGVRKVVWRGFGRTPDKRADFAARRSEIEILAKRQLIGTCIFVMDLGATPRLLERIEAGIANHYYMKDDSLFDRGMFLTSRWQNEEEVVVTFRCSSLLHGFPPRLAI
jgi:hypothetical protein